MVVIQTMVHQESLGCGHCWAMQRPRKKSFEWSALQVRETWIIVHIYCMCAYNIFRFGYVRSFLQHTHTHKCMSTIDRWGLCCCPNTIIGMLSWGTKNAADHCLHPFLCGVPGIQAVWEHGAYDIWVADHCYCNSKWTLWQWSHHLCLWKSRCRSQLTVFRRFLESPQRACCNSCFSPTPQGSHLEVRSGGLVVIVPRLRDRTTCRWGIRCESHFA